jgi:acetyltransferase-like isoleucine patch superfamily enzyme
VRFRGLTYLYASKGGKILFKGKGTVINNYSVSNAFGLYQRTIFYAPGGIITIGSNCGISGSTFCSMTSITVGNHVEIGANCKIMDNDQHSMNPVERRKDIRDNIGKKPVVIDDDCFIGAGCIILKGTTLGKNCIVGAGSVVHGEFPDNSVIAGNPARIIKKVEY